MDEVCRAVGRILHSAKLIMRFIFILSLAASCWGQVLLPQNWAGAGAAYNSETRPAVAGWFSYAVLISQKGSLYSFTSHDVFLSSVKPYTVETSVRSGLATVVRSVGPIIVLGFGDAGFTAGGTSIGGAFSGGGIGVIRLGKTNWTLELAARVIKSSINPTGNQTVYEIGAGRVWD